MSTGRTLILLCKTPVPGRVKTRLCPPCTPEQASGIAAAAIRQTMDAVGALEVDRIVLLDGDPGWVPRGWTVIPQVEGGLAERLAAGFGEVQGPAMVIGMDTPQVTADLISEGLDMASNGEVAIGPTPDGGWWGLAANPLLPSFVEGVPMSVDSTFNETVNAIRRAGFEARILPHLTDVDTFKEATAVAALIPDTEFAEAVGKVTM